MKCTSFKVVLKHKLVWSLISIYIRYFALDLDFRARVKCGLFSFREFLVYTNGNRQV